MTEDERQSALAKTWMLRERFDHDANRELVELLESPDDSVVLEAGRRLRERDLPPDLAERAAATLIGSRLETFEAAARALVALPHAIELAEPLLRVDVVADELARRRAFSILYAVEQQLARATIGKAARPDARFRALAGEVARTDPELAGWGSTVELAFDYFERKAFVPPWRHAEFIPEDILPLVVAGFRFGHGGDLPGEIGGPYPPGLVAISHRHGGMHWRNEQTFGYVLAVAGEIRDRLADYGNQVWRSAPSPAELAVWNATLAPLLGGRITSGDEGLLIADGPHPFELAGLPIVQFGSRFAPWRWNCDVTVDRDIVHDGEFGDAHVDALAALAEQFGWPPATLVLMDNSY